MAFGEHLLHTWPLNELWRPYTRSTDKRLLVYGLAGFFLRFGNLTFKNVSYAEVDKKTYDLTPKSVGKDVEVLNFLERPTPLMKP